MPHLVLLKQKVSTNQASLSPIIESAYNKYLMFVNKYLLPEPKKSVLSVSVWKHLRHQLGF